MCKFLPRLCLPHLASYPCSNWHHTLLHATFCRLARAKTGTGKTIAFLLPTIQRLFHPSPSPSSSLAPRAVQPPTGSQPYMGVQVLVLSPTRELALQTEKVARSLCTSSSWGSISLIGGTKLHTDQKRIQTDRADVLVAVRLSTHLMLPSYPTTHPHLSILDHFTEVHYRLQAASLTSSRMGILHRFFRVFDA